MLGALPSLTWLSSASQRETVSLLQAVRIVKLLLEGAVQEVQEQAVSFRDLANQAHATTLTARADIESSLNQVVTRLVTAAKSEAPSLSSKLKKHPEWVDVCLERHGYGDSRGRHHLHR